MKKIWIGAGLVCLMSLAGCGGSTPPETAKAPDAAPAAGAGGAGVPDEANGATVTGKVTFDGAKPAAGKPIDMSANPVCMRAHASSPQRPEDVVVNDNGTLKYA